MASFTKVHGAAGAFEAVGRNLFVKSFAKGSAMSQADLDALVEFVQQTSTITVIGAFVAGTTQTVLMIIEGADVAAAAGYTVTDVAGF